MSKILLMFLCFLFLLTGCARQEETSQTHTPSAAPSATPGSSSTEPAVSPAAPAASSTTPAPSAPMDEPSDAARISETLTATDKLLAKYIKASGNGLISLAGLGDLMGKVKAEAETASGYTTECLTLKDLLTETEDLSEYLEQFSSVQLNLSALNATMKEAKQNKDIDRIESALTQILSELQGYSKLLEQFLEEER